MTVPDPIADLIALVAADTDVAALADERVYGGEIPKAARGQMPKATVVLLPAGGPGRLGYNRYRKTRVLTVCYGETIPQAEHLHRAVREVLETLTRNGAIFSAEAGSDGAVGLDAETQWPTCIASYLVMSADES